MCCPPFALCQPPVSDPCGDVYRLRLSVTQKTMELASSSCHLSPGLTESICWANPDLSGGASLPKAPGHWWHLGIFTTYCGHDVIRSLLSDLGSKTVLPCVVTPGSRDTSVVMAHGVCQLLCRWARVHIYGAKPWDREPGEYSELFLFQAYVPQSLFLK